MTKLVRSVNEAAATDLELTNQIFVKNLVCDCGGLLICQQHARSYRQFARWKGAHVIGTASSANVDFVRSLGVDTVIDYRTTPFERVADEVDFVLDTIGGETLQRSLRLVKPGGTLVSIVEAPPAALAIHAIKNAALPNSAQLRQIVALIDEGHVTPVIRRRFPLREARQAHELVETGHGQGRIILDIAP